jgi:hypothetical protein
MVEALFVEFKAHPKSLDPLYVSVEPLRHLILDGHHPI